MRIALFEWGKIILNARPTSFDQAKGSRIDVVIYTDGSCPNPRKNDWEEPRIGGVIFCHERSAPVAFSLEIPRLVVDRLIPWVNQSSMVDVIAAPVAAQKPPTGHGSQDVARSPSLRVPGGHAMQFSADRAETLLKVPGVHLCM